MKRKSNPISLIAIIFIIGVISSFITSGDQFGALFENWDSYDIKTILDTLNLGLGLLVFGLLTAFFFYRVIRQGNDQDSKNPWEDEVN